MTKEQAQALLPVIKAWSEGKTIQCGWESDRDPWTDYGGYSPNFDVQIYRWRVKPEPRHFWVVLDKKAQRIYAVWEEPQIDPGGGVEVVHCVEAVDTKGTP